MWWAAAATPVKRQGRGLAQARRRGPAGPPAAKHERAGTGEAGGGARGGPLPHGSRSARPTSSVARRGTAGHATHAHGRGPPCHRADRGGWGARHKRGRRAAAATPPELAGRAPRAPAPHARAEGMDGRQPGGAQRRGIKSESWGSHRI